MKKTKVTQEQYDKLWDLWVKMCEHDNLDPNLEGAIYVVSDDNPYKKPYEDYKEELKNGK